jgi:hypothetical protein
MKVYLVVFTRYNSWGEIQKCFVIKCYKDRACANHKMVAEALTYARDGFAVSLVNDGVYINTMKAERKNTKAMEEEIIEVSVKEMEVI